MNRDILLVYFNTLCIKKKKKNIIVLLFRV